jgi:hypothetical protein
MRNAPISTEYYTKGRLHWFLCKRYSSMIRHSTCTQNRSSHPPGNIHGFPKKVPFWIFPGGDYFCLRYLLSDESWRIALRQKTMEIAFCIVFCVISKLEFVPFVCPRIAPGYCNKITCPKLGAGKKLRHWQQYIPLIAPSKSTTFLISVVCQSLETGSHIWSHYMPRHFPNENIPVRFLFSFVQSEIDEEYLHQIVPWTSREMDEVVGHLLQNYTRKK